MGIDGWACIDDSVVSSGGATFGARKDDCVLIYSRAPDDDWRLAEFDEIEQPHLNRHVFNRLGPKKWGFEPVAGCQVMVF